MIEKKLEEIKDNPSYSEELKDRIRERIDNAETEREARLEALSINRKNLEAKFPELKRPLPRSWIATLSTQKVKDLVAGSSG